MSPNQTKCCEQLYKHSYSARHFYFKAIILFQEIPTILPLFFLTNLFNKLSAVNAGNGAYQNTMKKLLFYTSRAKRCSRTYIEFYGIGKFALQSICNQYLEKTRLDSFGLLLKSALCVIPYRK